MFHSKQLHRKAIKYSLFSLFIVLALYATNLSNASAETREHENAHSLILSDDYTEHFLSPYLTQYEDKEKNISANDIISGLFLEGEKNKETGSIITFPSEGNPTWLSFDIVNRSNTTRWKIDFGNSMMGRFGLFDSVEAYSYNLHKNELTRQDTENGSSIELQIPKDQKTQIIVRIESKKGLPITAPLRLLHYEKKLARESNSGMVIFTTFMIGMAFFFSAVAFMRSEYQYLYFSLYYALFSILMLTQNYFVIGQAPLFGSAMIPALFLMCAISGLFIARLFWNINEKPKAYDRAFVTLIGISILLFCIGLFIPIEITAIKYALYYGPSLLILVLIPLISMAQIQRGNNETSAFMFGWLILLFGLCLTILALENIMPSVSTAINAFWYTLIPQAFFFVVASKLKLESDFENIKLSRNLEIDETETVSRLRQSKEDTEQKRLLKVIEQERRVLGELRKSEARRTDEMRFSKDEADQANKAKSAFLAVVSHEIRTPMTGIMGMVRLLLDSNLTKEQKEYAQTVQDSSDAMLALLNDILDFEKIEQGKMVFENISFDLHRLINGVTTLMNGHATQKNIELKTKIGDNLPKYVYGDPTRLRQVLLNLTGNAVKFTDQGDVTLTAELMNEEGTEDACKIYFGISDTGVGISQEAQKDLFSPFSQADSSISRKFGGTGLGLAISKGLVQGMGSNINISSNEGEGSTFFFTIEAPIDDSDTAGNKFIAPQKSIALKPLKVMVVDDNKINQKVIGGFLEKTDHTLTMIDDAQTAINRLEKETFDLILMDIEMPGLKGDEATKHIRESGNALIKNIPIIALTGNTMPQDIENYYAAGMNGVLAKPIDIDLLKSTINKAGQNIFDNPNMNVQNPYKKAKQQTVFKGAELKVTQSSSAPPQESTPSIENVLKSETLDTLKGHLKTADIQEMLNDVIEKNDEIITAMNEALAENKMADISARAHEMKGMAGNFGLMEMSDHAGKIEAKAKTEALLVLTGLLEPLPEMQKRAKEALDHWIDSNKD
jgi:signal transduction histidine kinase/DNA-binding NarL/FixJ family response regulator